MTVIDDLLAANREYAARFHDPGVSVRPALRLAVVSCMDSRIDLFEVLGLRNGEAHIIRNAGGVVTDDVVRSLLLSQRALGTERVLLVHHTDCGLHKVDEEEFGREVEAEVGRPLPFALEAFDDLDDDVRRSIARVRGNPFLGRTVEVRGFVYDVDTGELREVTP